MNLQEKELQGDRALWQVLGMSEAQEAGLYLCGEGGAGRVGRRLVRGREENGCEHRLCSRTDWGLNPNHH